MCQDVSRYEKIGGRVGEGTYGVVYKARDRGSNSNERQSHEKVVALKRCLPHHESSDGFPITTLREIQSLRICCSHPNIVTLLDVVVSKKEDNRGKSRKRRLHDRDGDDNDDKNDEKNNNNIGDVFLVFEYCDQDLAEILDSHHDQYHRSSMSNKNSRRRDSQQLLSPFTQSQVKTLIHQLLSAIAFCHDHYLIHRDIKPSNLLYDNRTGQLKLCDFGLSRFCRGSLRHSQLDDSHPQVLTPNVVSLWYRAPELLLKNDEKYSFPIDVWSCGCVVAELLQGMPLMAGKNEIDQISQMITCLGMPPTRIYHLAEDLISSSTNKKNLDQGSRGSGSSSNNSSKNLWDMFEYLTTSGLILLTRLLEYDPKERHTARQALESVYFDEQPHRTNPRDMPTFNKKKYQQQTLRPSSRKTRK